MLLAKLTTIAVLATLWTIPVAHQDDTFEDDSARDDRGRTATSRPLGLPRLDRRAFPDCVPLERWKSAHPAGPAGVPASFVVVRLDGSVQRMPVGEAWRRTPPEPHRNTEPTDDVWAIGACSR